MSEPTTDIAREFLAEAHDRLDDSVELIRHCLGQLDDAQIWWRPGEGMNSIGNLTLHLAGNLRQRFEVNVAGRPDVRDRFGEFTHREAIPKGELLRRFEESVALAGASLDSLAPETLAGMRSVQRGGVDVEATVLGVVFQTLTHLAGHAQEIVYMTRMQLGDRYSFRTPSLVPPAMRPNG